MLAACAACAGDAPVDVAQETAPQADGSWLQRSASEAGGFAVDVAWDVPPHEAPPRTPLAATLSFTSLASGRPARDVEVSEVLLSMSCCGSGVREAPTLKRGAEPHQARVENVQVSRSGRWNLTIGAAVDHAPPGRATFGFKTR